MHIGDGPDASAAPAARGRRRRRGVGSTAAAGGDGGLRALPKRASATATGIAAAVRRGAPAAVAAATGGQPLGRHIVTPPARGRALKGGGGAQAWGLPPVRTTQPAFCAWEPKWEVPPRRAQPYAPEPRSGSEAPARTASSASPRPPRRTSTEQRPAPRARDPREEASPRAVMLVALQRSRGHGGTTFVTRHVAAVPRGLLGKPRKCHGFFAPRDAGGSLFAACLSRDQATQILTNGRFNPTCNQRRVTADLPTKCEMGRIRSKIGHHRSKIGRHRTTMAEVVSKLADIARRRHKWPKMTEIAPSLAKLARNLVGLA